MAPYMVLKNRQVDLTYFTTCCGRVSDFDMADCELFCNGWTGQEELELLRALEENGYGNWKSIGEQLEKTPEECYLHYHRYYFNMKDIEVPDFTETYYSPDHFVCNFATLDLPGKEIPHYNPLREDFEIENDDRAEKFLTITEALLDDEPLDEDEDGDLLKRLTLALIDSYLRRLKRRETIKDNIRIHGLIEIYRLLSQEQTLSESEQHIKNSVRPFVRFLTPDQLFDLEKNFLKEVMLREKILLLQEYRKMGLKQLRAVEIYKRMKAHRETMRERKKKAFSRIMKSEEPFLQRNNVSNNEPSTVKKPSGSALGPLDVSLCSGVDLLHSDEKDFCSTFRILPDIFLRCKKHMILENKKHGFVRLMDARRVCRIDVNKTRKIYNFLVEKEIIRTSNQ